MTQGASIALRIEHHVEKVQGKSRKGKRPVMQSHGVRMVAIQVFVHSKTWPASLALDGRRLRPISSGHPFSKCFKISRLILTSYTVISSRRIPSSCVKRSAMSLNENKELSFRSHKHIFFETFMETSRICISFPIILLAAPMNDE